MIDRESATFTLAEFDAAFGEAKLELIDGRVHFGDDTAKRAFLLALGADEIVRLLGGDDTRAVHRPTFPANHPPSADPSDC